MQHKSDGYGITNLQVVILLCFTLILSIVGCNGDANQTTQNTDKLLENKELLEQEKVPSIPKLKIEKEYFVDGFDYPVGKPDAKNYYNAQVFGANNHLGDDWNGKGGGNTDLGDPIYAVAHGYVKYAKDITGGWGKVIRVNHYWENGRTCESLYAHCDQMDVKSGQWIKRGDKIGTIGNANGAYYAHLHFEIRSDTSLEIGGGYDWDTTGYVDPTKFIEEHRKSK